MPSIRAQRRTAHVFRPREPAPHPLNTIKQPSSFCKRSTERKPPTEIAKKQTTNDLQARVAKDRERFSKIIDHEGTEAEDKLLFGVFDDMLQEPMYSAPVFLRNGAPCGMADGWVCEQFSARSESVQWQSIRFLPILPGIGNGGYQMPWSLELDFLNTLVELLRLSGDEMLGYLLGLDVPPGTFREIVNPSYSPKDFQGALQEYYQDLQHGSTTTQLDIASTSLRKQPLFRSRLRTKEFQHLAEISPVQSQPDGHAGAREALPRRAYRLDGSCEAVGWKSALHRWKRSAGRLREWRVCPYVRTGSGHRLPLTYMARGQLDWLPSHRSMPAKSTGVPKTARRTRQEATTLHELDIRDIDPDTYGGDEVDEGAELQAIQAQSRDGIPLTIQRVSEEEITPGSIVPLPYLSYSGAIIGGEISLDRQIRQENHCTVYAATSRLYPDRNLEVKAFELQGITKSLRRYRKRNMEKVTNVVRRIRQGGYTFLVYEPDEKHAREVDTPGRARAGDIAPDINEFPLLVRPGATRAEATRLRQKRRRQKRREPPSSGIPQAWVKNNNPGLGVANVCSTPLVSKGWPGDIDFYNFMTKEPYQKHPDLFLASPATYDLLKHTTPSKLARVNPLSWIRRPRLECHFVGALRGKEEAFLYVQTLAELRSRRDRMIQLTEPWLDICPGM